MTKKTILKVNDDGNGLGIMRFEQNADIPNIEEFSTNELSGLYNMTAQYMYHARFFGTAEVQIESGDHAGKSFSISISEPK